MQKRTKLAGNGRWESSRMMLPQHVEALNKHARESQKLARPSLTDDEKLYISGLIGSARACGLQVTIKVFGEYEHELVTGYVGGIETRRGVMVLPDEDGSDWRWVAFADILEVDFDFGQ